MSNYRPSFVSLLSNAHANTPLFPQLGSVAVWADRFLELLFPQRAAVRLSTDTAVESALEQLEIQLHSMALQVGSSPSCANSFFENLAALREQLLADAQAIVNGDPAATGLEEVLLTYPGFYGTCIYRIAHALWQLKVPLLPRILSEIAHRKTGIDIHPGATIGLSLCIDHGTAIVVGETAVLGNNVKLYQGVTLGALSVEKSLASHKRHPTVEDNVIIYANATILGGSTVIGHDSIIGGNVWITESVPPFATVYNRSELIIRQKDQR